MSSVNTDLLCAPHTHLLYVVIILLSQYLQIHSKSINQNKHNVIKYYLSKNYHHEATKLKIHGQIHSSQVHVPNMRHYDKAEDITCATLLFL